MKFWGDLALGVFAFTTVGSLAYATDPVVIASPDALGVCCVSDAMEVGGETHPKYEPSLNECPAGTHEVDGSQCLGDLTPKDPMSSPACSLAYGPARSFTSAEVDLVMSLPVESGQGSSLVSYLKQAIGQGKSFEEVFFEISWNHLTTSATSTLRTLSGDAEFGRFASFAGSANSSHDDSIRHETENQVIKGKASALDLLSKFTQGKYKACPAGMEPKHYLQLSGASVKDMFHVEAQFKVYVYCCPEGMLPPFSDGSSGKVLDGFFIP